MEFSGVFSLSLEADALDHYADDNVWMDLFKALRSRPILFERYLTGTIALKEAETEEEEEMETANSKRRRRG